MLTLREFEVYMMVCEWAMDAATIAQQLGVGVDAVEYHLLRVRRKLGVHTNLQLLVQYHRRERCLAA